MKRSDSILTLWLTTLPTTFSAEDTASIATLEARWSFSDSQQVESGSLAKLQDQIKHYCDSDDSMINSALVNSTLIIPGEQVSSIRTTAPNKRALQAVPYLVEDQLATPLEELHISHHPQESNTELLVLAIDQQLLENLMHMAKQIGLQCTAIVPDYALLPTSDNISCCTLDQRLLCKLPTGEGFCLPQLQGDEQQLLKSIAEQQETEVHPVDLETTELMGAASDLARNHTLLTGRFTPTASHTPRQTVKAAGIAIAASCLLLLSYALIAGWQFHDRADAYYTMAEQHYRDLFPESKRITNLRRQLQGKLNIAQGGNGGSADFLQLLSKSVPALNNIDQYRIRQIRYNQSQNSLQVELVSRDMNLLNELQQDLQRMNLIPSIRSANNSEAGVLARLDISRASNR